MPVHTIIEFVGGPRCGEQQHWPVPLPPTIEVALPPSRHNLYVDGPLTDLERCTLTYRRRHAVADRQVTLYDLEPPRSYWDELA
jgi:hypothetical protein